MTNVAKQVPAHFRPAVSLNASDMAKSISETIDKIEQHIIKNDLTVVNEKGERYSSSSLKDMKIFYEGYISKMTKSAKKKLAKRIRNVNYKMSIRSINTFFAFLRNKVVGSSETMMYVKVQPSLEEQTIIASREKYKKLKAELELARQDYKSRKQIYHAAGKKYFSN